MRPFLPFFRSVLFVSLPVLGQTVASKPHSVTRVAVAKPDGLRVTHVSLYKNGVGFFEHEGAVAGDAVVTLDLTSAQLNDALQTLTAIDLDGGHITGANFNSTTPLAQQLGTLPLNLGEQPSQEGLYAALRGARVEVTGSGAAITGRILSLEIVDGPQPADNSKPVTEKTELTVVSDAGATRTLLLTPATTVRLLDAGLRTDLNTYLELLDRHRTEGLRHLTLNARGSGTRQLRVSFLSEVPVWKATYRLLTTAAAGGAGVDGPGKETSATMQGFSVVDNTTGEDWTNVKLSLIAGNPQSFLQPLAQPIYDRRPEIPIAANAQMTPQTHESSNEEPESSASANFGSAGAGNPTAMLAAPSEVDQTLRSPGHIARSMKMMHDGAAPPPASMSENVMVQSDAMIPYEEVARGSTTPNTTTAAFDDFFAYNVTDPVTIPRNGSALVPILQVRVPTESVTLWSLAEPRPLRALWVTNSSQLTLDRGSFSVVEDGAFAGEGLLEPVHPGERRLLSYAVDEAVRVTPDQRGESRHITRVTVTKGVLHAENSEVSEVKYTVANAAGAARTVVIEEPRRPGWTLDADAKPEETTPGEYRFRVVTAAHKSAVLDITQRHVLDESFRLADSTEDQLTLYLRGNGASPEVFAALQPVFAAKRNAAALDVRIRETQGKVDAIGADQKRLRENLMALKGSAEERALVRRYTAELNAQEDALAGLKAELAGLQTQRGVAEAELSARIEGLTIG